MDHNNNVAFFTLKTPRDMLNKAHREYQWMVESLNVDTVWNFFATVYHVQDYVKNLRGVGLEPIYKDPDFRMCRYLCNKGKHIVLEKNEGTYQATHTPRRPGALYGAALYGEATYGESPTPERYEVESEGKKFEVRDLGKRMLDKWESFFTEHNL
jgi:hypothetical protein